MIYALNRIPNSARLGVFLRVCAPVRYNQYKHAPCNRRPSLILFNVMFPRTVCAVCAMSRTEVPLTRVRVRLDECSAEHEFRPKIRTVIGLVHLISSIGYTGVRRRVVTVLKDIFTSSVDHMSACACSSIVVNDAHTSIV